MEDEHLNEILARFRGTRGYLWQLLIVAVLLALAINLIASVIYAKTGTYFSVALGLLLGFFCFIYLALSRLKENTYDTTINGFFVVKRDSGNVISVPAYTLASRFEDIATSAFSENPALERQWRTEIDKWVSPSGSRVRIIDLRVATEIAEYILLDALSTHLTDYFNTPSLGESQLETLERNDIPDVLLSNRILELISRELKDRPWYEPGDDVSSGGTVVAFFGPSGQYSHFDLKMPKGSSVRRTGPGSLVIDSKMISLELSARIGLSYGMPRNFGRYYLGVSKGSDLWDVEVEYRIHARIKRGIGLRMRSWQYYSWTESFIEKARDRFSGEEFFQRISWNSTETLLSVIFKNYPREQMHIEASVNALNEDEPSESTENQQ
jgi:hypothetical protein